MDEKIEDIKPIGKYYRHFKGNYYRVLNVAHNSENPDEEFVVYQAGYDDNKVWVRSEKDFRALVERDGKRMHRFSEVSEDEFFDNANININGEKVFKIFVSLPFTGKEDTIGERYEKACEELDLYWAGEMTQKYGILQIVSQSNIKDLIKTKKSVPDTEYPYYMGKDIELVLKCDGILMCSGWENSKGCQLEYRAAELFDKKIIYEDDLINNELKEKDYSEFYEYGKASN